MVHMIRYEEYFKNNVNGTTNFPNLGLVRTVKFTCDVTYVYLSDSLHRVSQQCYWPLALLN